ncbi:UNVERIFIED_CONTAM: hypothetical protein K2H54_048581 [Gekko kuhli]
MGHGGLYALVSLGLLVVASERSKDDVTRCWTKGKEVTIYPHQCPAEFDGADAKFCCRLCYGANCCLPKKPRVNLARCPRDAQLAGATRDRRTAPGAETTAAPGAETTAAPGAETTAAPGAETTAAPGAETTAAPGAETTAAPGAETTATPARKHDKTFLGLIIGALTLVAVYLAFQYCCLRWKRFWEYVRNHCLDGEEEDQATVNTVSSEVLPQDPPRPNAFPDVVRRPYAVHLDAPPPYSRFDPEGSQDLPPPYPREPARGPQGTRDLPPPYPGEPVVAFRRSSSRMQDDIAVILSALAAPPRATATGGAPRAAAIGAPEEADVPEADLIDFSEAAAIGGAPEEVAMPEAAATGGAPDEDALLGATASGGAPAPPE